MNSFRTDSFCTDSFGADRLDLALFRNCATTVLYLPPLPATLSGLYLGVSFSSTSEARSRNPYLATTSGHPEVGHTRPEVRGGGGGKSNWALESEGGETGLPC